MEIRDATEDDASAITGLATGDIDPQHLLRERTVRVATSEFEFGGNPGEDGGVVGFLAFDVQPSVVHVTRIGGERRVVNELLEDAIAFAESESLPVEAVVPDDAPASVALETRGFEKLGSGPRFEGRETTRFRMSVE